ncbi:hypothetical protein BKP37_08445 [Anaerobacillus alkalilacustris]|uniref:Methyl-accepting chemotaxis protein n=1 Tax=Anaerobacillus alkalilacustris TaxID=393763 RepID=A0A1S2LRS6_9BACI|nr:methyl-accepting chemotaxis protein [Anaerobacillus alkalilacustris]OIJ14367.1 hypothetical protein BKP37_08445 [Anaerobacillus alkalilacustris]
MLKKKGKKSAQLRKRNNKNFIFNNATLKTKLIVSFILLGVIPSIIIASFVFSVSRNTIEDKVSEMTHEIGFHLANNINTMINEIVQTTLIPFGNSELLDNLVGSEQNLTEYDIFQKNRNATDGLTAITNTNRNLENIQFVRNDGVRYGPQNIYLNVQEFINSDIKKQAYELNGTLLWSHGFQNDHENIYLFKSARDYSGRDRGVFIYTISSDIFNDVVGSDVTLERTIYIVDEENQVIASNNYEEVGNRYTGHLNTNNNSSELISHNELSNGWQVVISTQKSYLMKEINSVVYLIYLIVFICIVISILVGIKITYSITKPLSKMVALMSKAEHGDLTVQTDYLRNNEIGRLGQSFNNMLANIKNIIQENKKVAESAVENADHLKKISNESSEAAEQIATAIEEVAKGSVEQVDYAEKTNQEMKGLSQEILDVTNNVENVTIATAKTKDLSSNSISNMNELTTLNKDVQEKIYEIEQTIVKLGKDVTGIQGIIKIIKDISEQTNLLSLNASIEAARAGESGRGFAVVANEVRKLAEQSKESTMNIEKIINQILHQTECSVDLVRSSTTLFDIQTNSINKTRDSFEHILNDTNVIINDVSRIGNSIAKINVSKEKVEEAIVEMVSVAELSSSTTEEVTATTEEQFAAAEELGHLSERLSNTILELERMINKFKI